MSFCLVPSAYHLVFITKSSILSPLQSIPLIHRHIDPLFSRRLRVPEEKVHGGIAWKPSEVGKTPVKISFQNARVIFLDVFCGILPGKDPKSIPICDILCVRNIGMIYREVPAFRTKRRLKFELLSRLFPGKGNVVMSLLGIHSKIMKYSGNIR